LTGCQLNAIPIAAQRCLRVAQHLAAGCDRRVNESGYREILGICEGAKEDKTGWSAFLKFFPEAAWQRCIVGPLKKFPSRCLYAVAGSASVAPIGQALGEGVQAEIGLSRVNQRTKRAKRAAANRFKLMAAAVR
jgi:hypothetical protein